MQGERASRVSKGLAVVQMALYCSLGILAIPPPPASTDSSKLFRESFVSPGGHPRLVDRPRTLDDRPSLIKKNGSVSDLPLQAPINASPRCTSSRGALWFYQASPLSVPRQSYDRADDGRVTDYSGRFSDPH
jgi:hypothetical protein